MVKDKDHLFKYINKEVLRNESRSLSKLQLMRTTEVNGAAAGNGNGNDPAETLLKNLLHACSDEHDWSKMECFHLINQHPYVRFSREHVPLNLSQTRQVRLSSHHQGGGGGQQQASRDNHHDVYSRRETDQNYLQLLAKYESGELRLPKSPANICLYEFAAEYSLAWIYQPIVRVPQPTPLYKYVPALHRGENLEIDSHHLDYCRTMYVET